MLCLGQSCVGAHHSHLMLTCVQSKTPLNIIPHHVNMYTFVYLSWHYCGVGIETI